MQPESRSGVLHIYGQYCWHGQAAIVGNRKELEELRSTIDKALESGGAVSEVLYSNDGEGYHIGVLRLGDGDDSSCLAAQYTAEYAQGPFFGEYYYPVVDEDKREIYLMKSIRSKKKEDASDTRD